MSSTQTGAILTQIDRLFDGGSVVGLSEGALLDRFVGHRDEAAFEAIVARHGPMVLGVCRRALRDSGDVEDAFQATFLILVKKAGQIRDRDGLVPWLYGVARRVATRARTDAAKRRDRERAGATVEAESAPPDADRREFRAVIDEELNRLPEKYRTPILLCYLEGLTHEEAAAQLRWPVGTVRSRMAWARDRLRDRLTRRGLALPALLAGTAAASEAGASAVPSPLFTSTIQAAMALAAANGSTTAIVSATVASLTLGGLQTMSGTSLKMVAATFVVACGVTGGVAVVARPPDGPVKDADREPRIKTVDERFVSQGLDRVRMLDRNIQELETSISEQKEDRRKLLLGIQNVRTGLPVGSAKTPAAEEPAAKVVDGEIAIIDQLRAIDSEVDDLRRKMDGANTRRDDLMKRLQMQRTSPRPEVSPPAPATTPPIPSGPAAGNNPLPVDPATPPALTKMSTKVANRKAVENRSPIRERPLIVSTPDGNRVAIYREGSPIAVYRAPGGVKIKPLTNDYVVALVIEGKSISQLAAYSEQKGRWFIHDLKEPTYGQIWPLLSGINSASSLAVMRAGRYLCAFNGETGVWAITDMGEEFRTKDDGMNMPGFVNLMPGTLRSPPPEGMGGQSDGVLGPVGGWRSAAYRAGRRAFGYTMESDRWAVVDLGDASGGEPTQQGGKFFTVTSNKGLYIFNTASGQWDGVKLEDDKVEEKGRAQKP